jgi:hypothetical protein
VADTPCATDASDRGEPLHATASIVRNWVLVEQPGAWGRDAPLESRLPEEVASQLQTRARIDDFRLLLLRQPNPDPSAPRRCFVAHTRRPARWIEEITFTDPLELLDVEFGPLATGRPTGAGVPRTDPLFLICTNGKHDPCCARLGRPIVRALVPDLGDALWECSHIGGDRFAANLVCLPHGFYFGNLGPVEAAQVVESYRAGEIELEYFRGTAGDPYAVQAAEFYVRRDEGLRGVDDVVPVAYRKLEPGVVEVDLAGPAGQSYRVTVSVRASEEGRRLTCTATDVAHPPTFSLLDRRVT